MRFMIIVKATADSEAGAMPTDAEMAEMGRFHEELARAGVLLDAAGLKPTAAGWRVRYGADGSRTMLDGPFAESKELVAGYTIIQVKTREEAVEWTRRFPNPSRSAGEIEVRQLFELEDFEQGRGVEIFREMALPSQR